MKTGTKGGKIRDTKSFLVQSSAIAKTLGSTNGIMSGLLNSDVKEGRTFCISTLFENNITTLSARVYEVGSLVLILGKTYIQKLSNELKAF